MPHVRDGPPAEGATWARPLSGLTGDHPLFATYSLILATFLGTMGLPHVLVRFYTNPDGRAARTTTLVVLGLLGVFYLFPTVYGALGRVYAPAAAADRHRPTRWCWCCPARCSAACRAQLLAGLVAAGAFAAFLSTSSGLLVSVSGVLSTDVLGRWSGGHGSVRDFRRSAMVAGVVPLLLALPGRRPRTVHCGRSGVRGGGVDVLPAAGAGDLVAPADRRRRGRRAAGRRRAVRSRRCC